MNKENKEDVSRFSNAIGACALNFSKNLSTQHVLMLFNLLEEHDIADVEAAIIKHCKQSKFFPNAADLIELIPDRPFIADDGKMYVKSGDRLLRVHGPTKQLAKVQS